MANEYTEGNGNYRNLQEKLKIRRSPAWVLKKSELISWSVAILYGLTIAGYPFVSAFPLIFGAESRYFTIPYRGFVTILSIFIIIFVSVKRKRGYRGNLWLPLLIFWSLYFIRILLDTVIFPIPLAHDAIEYYLLSIGVCLIPMIALMIYIDEQTIKRAFYASLYLVVIACTLALYVNTLEILSGNSSTLITGRMASETLNPISLGHLGVTLVLLSGYNYLSSRKLFRWTHVLNLALIILGVFTIVVAGSRGPIISLITVIVALVVSKYKIRSSLKLLSIGILIMITIYGSVYFIQRKLDITPMERIQMLLSSKSGESISIRLQLYSDALNQFSNKPLIGSALVEKNSGRYPHNVVIESFMATGIVGGFSFCILLLLSVSASLRLISRSSSAIWIPILYIQYAVAALFSGALYNSYMMWSLMGATIALSYFYHSGRKKYYFT